MYRLTIKIDLSEFDNNHSYPTKSRTVAESESTVLFPLPEGGEISMGAFLANQLEHVFQIGALATAGNRTPTVEPDDD